MAFEFEFTDMFEAWWNDLKEDEQESVAFTVRLLQELGPQLKRPHADTLRGSQFANMRELRVQHLDNLFVFCMLLTLVALRYCCLAAIKPATGVGPMKPLRGLTHFTLITFSN